MERLFSKVLRTRAWAQRGWVTCPRSHSKHAHVDWTSLSRLLARGQCLESLGMGSGGMKAAPVSPGPRPSSLCPCSWRDLLATHRGRDVDNQSWPWTFPPPPSISQAWRQGQTPTREWTSPEVREVPVPAALTDASGRSPPHVPGVLGAEATRRSPHLACLVLGCARSG